MPGLTHLTRVPFRYYAPQFHHINTDPSRMMHYLFPLVFAIVLLSGCRNDSDPDPGYGTDTAALMKKFDRSPALSPEASMKKMKIENGFSIELVAAEPLVNTPVAMSFDERGRIWAIEMPGYMPDTIGTGEDQRNGKIVILEDTDHDGKADRRTVFLDSLVLPRALCLIGNGLLVAEPPNLWFVEINGDKPGRRSLVDKDYAVGGNVEHQPNGLLRGLDNWIYNAKSDKRYRKKGDNWLIEHTHFRGQYGITQDNYGRLMYNHNSANVLGDYFPAGLEVFNKNQRGVKGYSVAVVSDNRVYPSRPTTGVNRGYMEGILGADLRLVNFTAACGPVCYRGGLFGKEYEQNVFVAEPSANLIKRNILKDSGYILTGRQAYQEREFLASTDERFRPVNLYNGPDGALYIVDMYRGIIQHKTYLTDYLKSEIRKRDLEEPLAYGRIYRIAPSGKKATTPALLPLDPATLVERLGDPNGWVRDRAQQLLIDHRYTGAEPALRETLRQTDHPLAAIHALWTMEGLGVLQTADVVPMLQSGSWPLRMQALNVLASVMDEHNYRQYTTELERMLQQQDSLAAPLIAFLAHTVARFDKNKSEGLLKTLMKQYPENEFVVSAVISNLQDRETLFLEKLKVSHADTSLALYRQLQRVVRDIAAAKHAANAKLLKEKYPQGAALFTSTCQTCHGEDGNGLKSVAPPLNGSEWVTGDKAKLAAIVLYGLAGPIRVAGKLYEAPEITAEMPGIGNNADISDDQLAELLSFIRASWNNKSGEVKPQEIRRVREKFAGRQSPFTMDELSR